MRGGSRRPCSGSSSSVVGGITALFILAAPILIPPLTGAYDDLAVTLSQILFPIVVLIGLFGIVTGILNSYEQFTIPALTPVFWNLAIIIGLVIGVPRADTESGKLYVYAGSIVVGTVIQFLLPLPWLRGLDGRLRLALDIRDPAVKQVFKLMLPVMLGLGLINVNAVIGTFVASKLIDPELAPTAIDKAFRIYMLPQGMFSVAVATILYPSLARLSTRGDLAGFRATVSSGLRQINFMLIPSAVVCAVLAEPIVRLLYQRGAFEPGQTHGRRRRARRLLARAHVQRDDADAEPRLLQPAGAVGADPDRARRPRAEHRALRRLSTASAPGESRSRSRSRTSPASRCSSSRSAAASADSTCTRSPGPSGSSQSPRRCSASSPTASGTSSTARSAARSRRSSSRSALRSASAGAVYLAVCNALRVREMAALLSLRDRFRRD